MKILISLAFAVSVITASADSVRLPEIEIELPKKIGEFEFTERTQYDPGLGYHVAYAQRMGLVTIYVYNLNREDIPSEISSQIILKEVEDAEAEIRSGERSGQYKNLKKHALEDALASQVSDLFATSSWTFDIPGGGCKSYVFLRAQAGNILKVRATMYILDGKSEDHALAGFMEALIAEITNANKTRSQRLTAASLTRRDRSTINPGVGARSRSGVDDSTVRHKEADDQQSR